MSTPRTGWGISRKETDRVFARNRAIIGRKVEDCHPPKSVHIVEAVVSDLKSGKRDVAEFWIQMGPRFVHIRYFAMRDDGGEFLGTLEVTQDIAPLRALEGERRLLAEVVRRRSRSMIISPETKVGDLLDAYPEAEAALIAIAPKFKALKNPVLRRTVAKVATLEQAARVADMPVNELVRSLRQALGQDAGEIESGGAGCGRRRRCAGLDRRRRQARVRRRRHARAGRDSGRQGEREPWRGWRRVRCFSCARPSRSRRSSTP